MTSQELQEQMLKQREKEFYENAVREYLRIKKLVCNAGDLTHDEVCNITMLICRYRNVFANDRSMY